MTLDDSFPIRQSYGGRWSSPAHRRGGFAHTWVHMGYRRRICCGLGWASILWCVLFAASLGSIEGGDAVPLEYGSSGFHVAIASQPKQLVAGKPAVISILLQVTLSISRPIWVYAQPTNLHVVCTCKATAPLRNLFLKTATKHVEMHRSPYLPLLPAGNASRNAYH